MLTPYIQVSDTSLFVLTKTVPVPRLRVSNSTKDNSLLFLLRITSICAAVVLWRSLKCQEDAHRRCCCCMAPGDDFPIHSHDPAWRQGIKSPSIHMKLGVNKCILPWWSCCWSLQFFTNGKRFTAVLLMCDVPKRSVPMAGHFLPIGYCCTRGMGRLGLLSTLPPGQ